MLKGVMLVSVNKYFQEGDEVEIKKVDVKSGLALCYNKKTQKTEWLFVKDIFY